MARRTREDVFTLREVWRFLPLLVSANLALLRLISQEDGAGNHWPPERFLGDMARFPTGLSLFACIALQFGQALTIAILMERGGDRFGEPHGGQFQRTQVITQVFAFGKVFPCPVIIHRGPKGPCMDEVRQQRNAYLNS